MVTIVALTVRNDIRPFVLSFRAPLALTMMPLEELLKRLIGVVF